MNETTSAPTLDEPRFSVPEAAQKLRMSKNAVFTLIARREIGSFKLGRQIWVPQSAINAYLAKCFRPAAAEGGHKPRAIEVVARRKVATGGEAS